MGLEIRCRELDHRQNFKFTNLGREIKVGDIITCFAPQFEKNNAEVYPISNEQLKKEIDLTEEIIADIFEYKRTDVSDDLGSKFEILSIKD